MGGFTTHEEYLASLPVARRQAIESLTEKLIKEEATLRELREISSRSQEDLAKRLSVNQSAVSKLERRTDIYISSLRHYIEALGGELVITAKLPGKAPVEINQFRDLAETSSREDFRVESDAGKD